MVSPMKRTKESTQKPKDALKSYLEEAQTWETSKTKELVKSTKLAWRVATGACILAGASVLAVAGLTPLKSVEPYVIRVDSTTGIVDIARGMRDSKTTYDEAINKYFTQWYVKYREGYTRELAEEYYKNVGTMSSPTEQQKYFEWFNPKNPQSPLVVYGTGAKVRINIKSISFIKPDIALVRYTRGIERGTDRPELTHWAATVTFKYYGASMTEVDRGINPLGFKVIDYRNDPDAAIDSKPGSTPQPETTPVTSPSVTLYPTATPASAPAPTAAQNATAPESR